LSCCLFFEPLTARGVNITETGGQHHRNIQVKDDTIIVTFYGPSQYIKKEEYMDLPNKLISQGINPKIPWLYDFKLDFRFK
jgi:hypothetical protein